FAEIIGHDKTAASEVLPEVGDLLVGEFHETGLGNVQERVLKNVVAAELNDAIGAWTNPNTRQFVYHVDGEFIRRRVIVVPRRFAPVHPPFSLRKLYPGENEFRVFRRRRIRDRRTCKYSQEHRDDQHFSHWLPLYDSAVSSALYELIWEGDCTGAR